MFSEKYCENRMEKTSYLKFFHEVYMTGLLGGATPSLTVQARDVRCCEDGCFLSCCDTGDKKVQKSAKTGQILVTTKKTM